MGEKKTPKTKFHSIKPAHPVKPCLFAALATSAENSHSSDISMQRLNVGPIDKKSAICYYLHINCIEGLHPTKNLSFTSSLETVTMHSNHEPNRAEKLKNIAIQQQELDCARIASAATLFIEKTNLEKTIVQKVYPALVVIETPNFRMGMGFFQYNAWLVSNAHVIKNRAEIDSGVVLRKHDDTKVLLEAEQSYHRPWASVVSPDIVVVNTRNHHASIPTNPLSLDPTHNKSHYFYIDIKFEIHYLLPASSPGSMPMLFRCQDGTTPQPGCSGTPIFSAKMTIEKPTWTFEILGALYARCTDTLGQMHQFPHGSQKLVCCVPIAQDFEQIRRIMISLDCSDNYQKKSACSVALTDLQQKDTCQKMSEREKKLADDGILEYKLGHTVLEIERPEGLEKLDGNGFYKLEQSHLIRLMHLSLKQIEQTFSEFIEYISQFQSICINVAAETTLLSQDHWRLDCKPGTNGQYRLLQLQDNTGKGVKVKGKGKSASSVFAEVKVPENVTVINGQFLAEDLLKSRNNVDNQHKHPSIVIGGYSEDERDRLKKYMKTERSGANTPISMSLFAAVSESSVDGFKTIKQCCSDINRINSVNKNGDTPLMVLLNNPQLCDDPSQLSKVKWLATHSIWNQANNDGRTAFQILNDHPQKYSLEGLRPAAK